MSGNGYVISGTPIAVDTWQKSTCPQARLFFLSHFHSDHMVGLSSSWDFPIYTSDITAQLLIKKTGIKPSFVKSLEMNVEHLIPLDIEGCEMLCVTLYDANHCPGSVMFLFQGYFGNILYTGDFRYVPNLLNFSSLPQIDVLYLDNTYCSPKCIFPKRENAVDDLLNTIHACLHHSKRVFLGLDNLGKEDALKMIARETHTKVYVTPDKKQTLDILGLSDIITLDKNCAKVFVVPTNCISGSNIKKWNYELPTCAVLVTAKYCGFSFKPFSTYDRIHVVSLSNHSSYEELKEFVRQIEPKVIIPLVGKNVRGIFNTDISDRADMSVFSNYLSSNPRTDFAIPKTVEKAMNLWKENNRPAVAYKRQRRQTVTRFVRNRAKRRPGVNFSYAVTSESESSCNSDVGYNEEEETLFDDTDQISSGSEFLGQRSILENLEVNSPESSVGENLELNSPESSVGENLELNSPISSIEENSEVNSPMSSIEEHLVVNSPMSSIEENLEVNSFESSIRENLEVSSPEISVEESLDNSSFQGTIREPVSSHSSEESFASEETLLDENLSSETSEGTSLSEYEWEVVHITSNRTGNI